MSFVSYAQNFEDVMLWRALQNVECGFYIDVGANDPNFDSVTKAFYDRGWHGINVEPITEWYSKLVERRPRDINLQVAAGASEGQLELYEIAETGLSTSVRAIAERHEAERGYEANKRVVEVRTLNSICEEYVAGAVHFLKIDVEGAEKDVLLGLDLLRFRPWIIVVESTMPNSQSESYSDWESLIISVRYDFAYFDGLNRFYVSQEHSELKDTLNAPPNFFDGFLTSREATLAAERSYVEERARNAEERARTAEHHARSINARLLELQALHEKVIESTSWRITAPMRACATQLKNFAPNLSDAKSAARTLLVHARLYVLARPRLTRVALIAIRVPMVQRFLTRLLRDGSLGSNPSDISELGPQSRKIFLRLASATRHRQTDK